MRFKIHRGANEIGGSRVEVWTDSARIVIDLGMPLVNPDRTPFDTWKAEKRSTEELIRENILPDIPSLVPGRLKYRIVNFTCPSGSLWPYEPYQPVLSCLAWFFNTTFNRADQHIYRQGMGCSKRPSL